MPRGVLPLPQRLVVFLDRANPQAFALHREDAVETGFGTAQGGHDRNPIGHSSAPDFHLVFARDFSARGVDDELDLAVLDHVADVRATLGDFVRRGRSLLLTLFVQVPKVLVGCSRLETLVHVPMLRFFAIHFKLFKQPRHELLASKTPSPPDFLVLRKRIPIWRWKHPATTNPARRPGRGGIPIGCGRARRRRLAPGGRMGSPAVSRR